MLYEIDYPGTHGKAYAAACKFAAIEAARLRGEEIAETRIDVLDGVYSRKWVSPVTDEDRAAARAMYADVLVHFIPSRGVEQWRSRNAFALASELRGWLDLAQRRLAQGWSRERAYGLYTQPDHDGSAYPA